MPRERLQRIDKSMSGEAREMFAKYVPAGDLAAFARKLPGTLRQNFVEGMLLLRDESFQELIVGYPRPPRSFVKAYELPDTVSSTFMLRDIAGTEYKPEDYLAVFNRFVTENPQDRCASTSSARPRALATL